MPTHVQAALEAATDAVTALVAVGSAQDATLVLRDDTTVISVHDMAATPFGAAAATGVATAGAIDNAVAVGTGTIDNYQIRDKDDALVISGLATMAGADPLGDVIVNNTNVVIGQNVSVTSLTYKALPQ